MTKLLPLFVQGYNGIEVLQASMAEQLAQCIDW